MKTKFDRTRLISYSSAGLVLFPAASDVQAQIISVDLDPDLMVEVAAWYDYALLDMDGDGEIDLSLHAGDASSYGTNTIANVWAYGVGAHVYNQETWIPCGSYYTPDPYGCDAVMVNTRIVSAPISFGDTVHDSTLDFQPYATITAYESDDYYGGTFETEDGCVVSECWASGYSYTYYGGGVGTLGVRFIIGDDIHYGYITIGHLGTGSGEFYTIESYAYNATPDEMIIVGDTINCSLPEIEDVLTAPVGFKVYFSDAEGLFNNYEIRYREAGSTDWSKKKKDIPVIKVSGLACSTLYEYQYRTVCGDTDFIKRSGWSEIQYVSTNDCRLADQRSDAVSLYPNPSTGSFYIRLIDDDLPENVAVYNSAGQLVKLFEAPNTSSYMVSDLTPGMYQVVVRVGEAMHNLVLVVM